MIKKLLGITILLSFAVMATGLVLAQTESPSPLPPPPSPSPSSSPLVSPSPKTKNLDPACMQIAVDKRETAIIAGVDAYSVTARSALSARKDALKTAWGIADVRERRMALKKVWRDFKFTSEKARKDFKSAKRTVWDQFNKDRKACGSSGASDDPTNVSADNNL